MKPPVFNENPWRIIIVVFGLPISDSCVQNRPRSSWSMWEGFLSKLIDASSNSEDHFKARICRYRTVVYREWAEQERYINYNTHTTGTYVGGMSPVPLCRSHSLPFSIPVACYFSLPTSVLNPTPYGDAKLS